MRKNTNQLRKRPESEIFCTVCTVAGKSADFCRLSQCLEALLDLCVGNLEQKWPRRCVVDVFFLRKKHSLFERLT